MVEADQLRSRLHPLAGQQAIEQMHPSAEARQRLHYRHQGPGPLQLVGAAEATKTGANDHQPRRSISGLSTPLAIRQHQGGASGQAAEQKLPAAEGRGPGARGCGEFADQTSAHIKPS
jgi:hypothetical protein